MLRSMAMGAPAVPASSRSRRDRTRSTVPVPTRAPRFPGTPAIVDGSEAIASVEVRISDAACAYPITPSTTMAAIFQAAVAEGRTNLWGTPLRFIEPESEHSSASAAEGFALAGGRVTNFTAGQGLILMKEVM
jgi:pyruvate-ferredoxin/flavodoxin oxidoreductase